MRPDNAAWRAELASLAPGLADAVPDLCDEAARILSPAGISDWVAGARGLVELGKGSALAEAWVNALPKVARECGEAAIRDCAVAFLRLASLTSGDVLALAIATLPRAAARLADADLLRAYLDLLHRLAAKAPRGLRPMFGVLDELLDKLTLSGLQRWIEFGAEAYRRDLAKQAAYFSLATEDSRSVLETARQGTLFVDSQRRLNLYLRALWGRDFHLRPTAAGFAGFRPFIEDGGLHLPDAVDDDNGIVLYRAMTAHMAAHCLLTPAALEGDGLSPAERHFVGLVEDARVEALAMRGFPGLRSLWRSLLPPASPDGSTWISALTRALLDPDAAPFDRELDALVAEFHAGPLSPGMSPDLGLRLFALQARRRMVPSLRLLEAELPPWRDDNRFLWEPEGFDGAAATAPQQTRRRVGLMEFINEVDAESADASEIWTLASELFPYEDDGISFNAREGREPVSDPVHYPEFDHRTQLERPAWTTLTERRPRPGAPDGLRDILVRHRGVASRIRRIIDRLRPQGVIRERKLEDGDELDLDAAVEAAVMVRLGRPPDPRITRRNRIARRDLALVVLLDLSESTNDRVRGGSQSVLDLTREAAALIATAVDGIGDAYAIHGFASNGRHDVRYFRFKDFGERLDDIVRGRLAGMTGGLSTRMGAAIRHAGRHLSLRREKHRLLLVLTDGEPADIDETDPVHLRMDARHAIAGLRRTGVNTYGLTLDPLADRYVEGIFGSGRYTVIDKVERLPETLPLLFARLTG